MPLIHTASSVNTRCTDWCRLFVSQLFPADIVNLSELRNALACPIKYEQRS